MSPWCLADPRHVALCEVGHGGGYMYVWPVCHSRFPHKVTYVEDILIIYIITYDNYWTFLGRVACQDIIISGGENISSLEVESIMMKHEKIAEVAVVARRTT